MAEVDVAGEDSTGTDDAPICTDHSRRESSPETAQADDAYDASAGVIPVLPSRRGAVLSRLTRTPATSDRETGISRSVRRLLAVGAHG